MHILKRSCVLSWLTLERDHISVYCSRIVSLGDTLEELEEFKFS